MKKQRCLCNLCTYWSPLEKEIMDALPENLKPKFEHLCMNNACVALDLEVAEAKLAGDWPDWEWMKAAVHAAEYAEAPEMLEEPK